MKKLGRFWNRYCDDWAKKQGWALFDADGLMRIQKIDEPEEAGVELKSDSAAIQLVVKQALGGCKLSALALWLDGNPTKGETIYAPAELMVKPCRT